MPEEVKKHHQQEEEEEGGQGLEYVSPESFFEEVYTQNLGSLQLSIDKCKYMRDELMKYDKDFVKQVMNNVYVSCTRVGLIWKCTQRMLKADEWSEKFCIITNAGIVYFNT